MGCDDWVWAFGWGMLWEYCFGLGFFSYDLLHAAFCYATFGFGMYSLPFIAALLACFFQIVVSRIVSAVGFQGLDLGFWCGLLVDLRMSCMCGVA
jgi:hypothetical protein